MTFRVRTALVVLVLTALTMGGAFAGVWHYFISSQQRQLDGALLEIARREASEAAAGQVEFTDAPGPTANAVGPLPKYGVLYGINGFPISQTDNFETIPPMPRVVPFERAFDFDHDGMAMRGVVVGVGNTGRRVFLAAPREDFEEDAKILTRAMAIAFAVGCLWAGLIAYGVATRLTREHAIVGDVARRVASGDTSARVSFRAADTDMRQLADDLNAMIQRLVGLLAVQERFIAHAAHELRTPLTSLRIELEHAIRSGRDRNDYDAALKGALESTRRLSDLAEDLLELARVKRAPGEGPTAIEDALSDAIADVAPAGRQRDVFIVAEPLSAMVRGDRRSLARLFRNVIENAVRFSPRSSKVWVDTRIDDGEAVLTITDVGPGVTQNDAERIFEPFARASHDDDRSYGAGLGLSIARTLARSLGGDVVAQPRTGGRFVIRVPLWSDAPAPSAYHAAAPSAADAAYDEADEELSQASWPSCRQARG